MKDKIMSPALTRSSLSGFSINMCGILLSEDVLNPNMACNFTLSDKSLGVIVL